MDKYVIRRMEIEGLDGTDKAHFLNLKARRLNRSLGSNRLVGLGLSHY